MRTKYSVILIIRDGWGYNIDTAGNFIKAAKTPNFDSYIKSSPNSLLKASGQAVGLKNGYQGNSEIGHLTIGSGRIMLQSLPKIDKAINNGEFFDNKTFTKVIKECHKNNRALHLMGLLQDQGVHAHTRHLFALLDLCKKENFKNVLIHVITDGRDATVFESLKHLKALNNKLKSLGFGKIVSVSGRYFSMDRDKRWLRTKKAYDCISYAKGNNFIDPLSYIKSCHNKKQTDEFIVPGCLESYKGLNKGDGMIFFNFRTDRPRQLSKALTEKNFSGFKRKLIPINFVSMTAYYSGMPFKAAFENEKPSHLLGEIISGQKLKQLRISETEKYAHVTFFFDCQKEKNIKGEDRILIKSPKVATYNLKPEMSAFKIAARLEKEIKKAYYDFIVVNLVNCDMVGHTSDRKAIIKAVESVDISQGRIISAGLKNGYSCLLVADHGNAEDKSKLTATSHTTNRVPFVFVSNNELFNKAKLKNGGLADVAPTILKIMHIRQPKDMTGKPLVSF